MLNYVLYEGQLYMFGIGDSNLLSSLFSMKGYRLVCKDREADLSLIANQLYTVCTGAVVRDEAPGAASCKSVGKLEGSTYAVFCLVQSSTVGAESAGTHNGSEELLQEVYLMWCQIVEISASGYVSLYTPWE